MQDDTKAIKEAMNSGKRCGAKCNGSTTKNAIVYFPPGKYLISSSIPVPFGTQIIGDVSE
jgi:Fe-S-cluster containining protein